MADFMRKHRLEHTPVYCSPGTNHYSYPKGATILGLGDKSVIPIEVDRNCRMNLDSKFYCIFNTEKNSHAETCLKILCSGSNPPDPFSKILIFNTTVYKEIYKNSFDRKWFPA